MKGWKALGNKLIDYKLMTTKEIKAVLANKDESTDKDTSEKKVGPKNSDKINPGDVIDFDLSDGQPELF